MTIASSVSGWTSRFFCRTDSRALLASTLVARFYYAAGWCPVGGAGVMLVVMLAAMLKARRGPTREGPNDRERRPHDFRHTITLGGLRDLLDRLPYDLPDDTPVILAKDAEGNGYSPLASFELAMYEPESTWSGQTYPTPEEMAQPGSGWGEDDAAPDGAVRVVELGPVN